MRTLSTSQARSIDQIAIEQFHLPGIVLMENAGRECAKLLLQQNPTGPVTILAGKGNNAGDGFVIARHLHNQGLEVRLLLASSPDQFHGDALINWQVIRAMKLPWKQYRVEEDSVAMTDWLSGSTWLVDALLGTGVQGTVREPFSSLIEQVNCWKQAHPDAGVMAVDLPSGLNGDSGEICGACIQADMTATFVALKTGLTIAQGPNMAGTIHVVEIGVPKMVIDLVAASSSSTNSLG